MDPVRHGTLYFPDGNFVICSDEAGPEPVAFRVHTSVLAGHSAAFRRMFSALELQRIDETYDGVPFVRTTDSAREWEDLLGIFYYTKPLQYRRGDPDNPIRLRPAMTLAHKYHVHGIRTEIERKMRSEWPTTLAELDNLESELAIFPTHAEGNPNPTRYDNVPEPATAISFARDFMPEILPVIFYCLSCKDLGDDWDRYAPHARAYQVRTAKWSVCEMQDLVQISRYRTRLPAYWKAIVGEWKDAYTSSIFTLARACLCSPGEAQRVWDSAYDRVCESQDIILELKRLVSADRTDIDESACPTCEYLIQQS